MNTSLIDKKKELSIVVIDDNELSRRTVVDILEKAKFNVVGSARNANQALELLANKRPTLMIIDIIMPEMSGIELSQKILEKQSDTNIIMMSSLDSENIIIEAISSGAIDFIKKPFTKETLIDSVEKVKQNLEKL
jgi:two-component system chemotaxis response regulator CheY